MLLLIRLELGCGAIAIGIECIEMLLNIIVSRNRMFLDTSIET